MRDSNPQPLRPKRSRLPNWRNPRFFTHYDAPHQSFDCRELHPIHHSFQRKIPIGGEDGIRTHDLVLARDLLSQLSYNPINNLENFIKNMIVGFYSPYSYNATHYSATVTISLSPRAVALKLLTAVSEETQALRGICLPPTFTRHSEYLIIIPLLSSNQTEPWATRTTVRFLHVSV